jgi:Terminase large subunit, T4likevirus-type, N-terminal
VSAPVDIATALADEKLLGASFPDLSTWETWLAVIKAAFGRPLNREERRAFESVAGGRKSPQRRVRELWALLGRRSGKSRIAASLAVYLATLVDHSPRLSPGEIGMVLVLAASRAQASVVFGYAKGILEASPLLSALIESVSADEIKLSNGIVIATHSASHRTVRGRTIVGVIFDEVSFWRDETGALPDKEIYRAVLPALATTGGLLIGISSPYRQRGLLHDRFKGFFGQDSDDVLVVKGATELFNPTIDKDLVAQARIDDIESARAEWDGEFRTDSSALLEDELIDDAIDRDRPLELPYRSGRRYVTFVDASAGRHDAFCMCVAHREEERIVVDLIRGRKPPFDPATVAAEFSGTARAYGCTSVTGDNYSGDWVKKAFEAAGVQYLQAEKPKSQLYLEGLTAFTRGQLSFPEHKPLIRELRLLERRVSRSGKDAVDHPVGGADDHANVLFGAITMLAGGGVQLNMTRQSIEAFGKGMAEIGRRSQAGTLRAFGRGGSTSFCKW